MDMTKWKSILVPRDVYLEIRELAHRQNRTISGQLREIFEFFKEEKGLTDLKPKD